MESVVNQCNTPQNKFYSKYLGSCTQVKEKYENEENQCDTPQNKFMSKYQGACYNNKKEQPMKI